VRLWLLLAWLGAIPVGAAPTDAPSDFAFGIAIETPERAAIYRLPVPPDVYRTATRADLGDLRIFNAEGAPVPHALRHPRSHDGAASATQMLPFYPFEQSRGGSSERVFVKVYTDPDGAVVDVDSGGARPTDQRTVSYLIDATGLARPPSALTIDWQGPDVAHIALHTSDDLHRWRTLRSDATLARLAYAGHQFEQRRIEIPQRTYKYLRLTVPERGVAMSIIGVQAELAAQTPEPRRDALRAVGVAAEDAPNAWLFDTGGRMPVDRVDLALPQANSVVRAVLSSRPQAKAEWHARGSGVLYRLDVGETELSARSIDLSPVTDRFWRLEIPSDAAGLGPAPPELRFAWRPHELQFLARGSGPFLLAYGNADMQPSALPIDEVLERLGKEQAAALVATVNPAEPVTLGGADRLRPSRGPIPWRTLLLWTVLVLGVAFLGWMAWRLFRQMNA